MKSLTVALTSLAAASLASASAPCPAEFNPGENKRDYSPKTSHPGQADGATSLLGDHDNPYSPEANDASWSADGTIPGQWMQINAQDSNRHPQWIVGVTIQGRKYSSPQYVTSYKVSVDGVFVNAADGGQIFAGTPSKSEENVRITTNLETPVLGKLVRIWPQTFEGHMSMRAGLVINPCGPLDQNQCTEARANAWTNTVNVDDDSTSISKNGIPESDAWNAAANSVEEIYFSAETQSMTFRCETPKGNSYWRFPVATKTMMAGFGNPNAGGEDSACEGTHCNITFAIACEATKTPEGNPSLPSHLDFSANYGQMHVYENGVDKGDFGTWDGSTVFAVEVEGTVVRYLKNGAVFHTSERTVSPSINP
jgi:hypothetical protein